MCHSEKHNELLVAITMSQVKAVFTAFPQPWSEHVERGTLACKTTGASKLVARLIPNPNASKLLVLYCKTSLPWTHAPHAHCPPAQPPMLTPHGLLPFLCWTHASTIVSFNVLVILTDCSP